VSKKSIKKQKGISCQLLLVADAGGVKRRDARPWSRKQTSQTGAWRLSEDSCADGEDEAAERDLVDAGCAIRLGKTAAGGRWGRGRLGCSAGSSARGSARGRRTGAGSGHGGVTTGDRDRDDGCGGHDGSGAGDNGCDWRMS
jgi:hypothetical protein